ncbi:hypothetical protein DUNSADRAFT_4268 [Dunaliella salina]|uniref:Encoded protein n=1 Tax=Dunaliella salina TaxID=3046 RepID=A0ABQ7FUV8_DUNSA|nr:hypothetical protein DUNSADRAFT_4268 [Dunaliella salina]|eukprot:KAF5826187.1 hypothetical protein DUNSADRAFT_4268 [Dunaliella salina]
MLAIWLVSKHGQVRAVEGQDGSLSLPRWQIASIHQSWIDYFPLCSFHGKQKHSLPCAHPLFKRKCLLCLHYILGLPFVSSPGR